MDGYLPGFCSSDVPGQLEKKHPNDAGLDIRSSENMVILPGDSALVSTGLRVAIMPGCVGIVKSRSGLSVNHSIEVGAGVIDSDFNGEIRVKLYNHGKEPFYVSRGDRIAQLLTIPVLLGQYIYCSVLSDSDRGEKGFGSSGVG